MPSFDLDVLLRFDITIEAPTADRAEEIANELIEDFYGDYDGIKNIEIVDWNMLGW